jgi:hypothetical protein
MRMLPFVRLPFRFWLIFMLSFCLLISSQSWVFSATTPLSYRTAIFMLNGERVNQSLPVKVVNGSTLVALKSLVAPMGGSISSVNSGNSRSVWLRIGSDKFRFVAGSAKVLSYQDSNFLGEMWLSQVAAVHSGLFFVPLKETAALLSYQATIEKRTYSSGKVESIVKLERIEEDSFEADSWSNDAIQQPPTLDPVLTAKPPQS